MPNARTRSRRRFLGVVATTALACAAACAPPYPSGPIRAIYSSGSSPLDPVAHDVRIHGRIDTTKVPVDATTHVHLVQGGRMFWSSGAHTTCTSGSFSFSGVPPGDWYVMVDACRGEESWWFFASVEGLVEGERRDLGELTLAPTRVVTRSRIDGHISRDPDDFPGHGNPSLEVTLHALGSTAIPIGAHVDWEGRSFEHVFHGVPLGSVRAEGEAFAPLRPGSTTTLEIRDVGRGAVLVGGLFTLDTTETTLELVHTVGPTPP